MHAKMVELGFDWTRLGEEAGIDRTTVSKKLGATPGYWDRPRRLAEDNLRRLLEALKMTMATPVGLFTVATHVTPVAKSAKVTHLPTDEQRLLDAYRRLREAIPSAAPGMVAYIERKADEAVQFASDSPRPKQEKTPPAKP
jgi:hypothetical protein